MNPLRDMIINEIVRPEIKLASKIQLGVIEVFNASSNTVDIRIGGLQDEPYKKVPFARGVGYIHGTEPSVGTPVIVSFLNSDLNYPYILTILNKDEIDSTTGKSTMVPAIAMSPNSDPLGGGGGFSGSDFSGMNTGFSDINYSAGGSGGGGVF